MTLLPNNNLGDDFIFSAEDKDIEAISNLQKLKKQIVLIQQERTKAYAQAKRANKS
tara:strand:+ start:200 stop:367 length:168 start_codon:yes stop_codon:yes gene_type:complete